MVLRFIFAGIIVIVSLIVYKELSAPAPQVDAISKVCAAEDATVTVSMSISVWGDTTTVTCTSAPVEMIYE